MTEECFRKTVCSIHSADGRTDDGRSNLRVGLGPSNQVFVLNKGDAAIRLLAR
jgi:hypothetical protein